MGAVFAGNMNALIFSLLGGFSAMLVMILLSRSRHLSIYGVSVGGAAAHNCGQIAAACLTLGSMAPLYYLPILLGASLITGAVTGRGGGLLVSSTGPYEHFPVTKRTLFRRMERWLTFLQRGATLNLL